MIFTSEVTGVAKAVEVWQSVHSHAERASKVCLKKKAHVFQAPQNHFPFASVGWDGPSGFGLTNGNRTRDDEPFNFREHGAHRKYFPKQSWSVHPSGLPLCSTEFTMRFQQYNTANSFLQVWASKLAAWTAGQNLAAETGPKRQGQRFHNIATRASPRLCATRSSIHQAGSVRRGGAAAARRPGRHDRLDSHVRRSINHRGERDLLHHTHTVAAEPNTDQVQYLVLSETNRGGIVKSCRALANLYKNDLSSNFSVCQTQQMCEPWLKCTWIAGCRRVASILLSRSCQFLWGTGTTDMELSQIYMTLSNEAWTSE